MTGTRSSLPRWQDHNHARPISSQGRPRKGFAVFTLLSIVLIAFVLLARYRDGPGDDALSLGEAHSPSTLEGEKNDTGDLSLQISDSGVASQDNWRLHPEHHSYREPTTLEYTWRITAEDQRPDGVLKRVYIINGASPGPTIEARSGDRLVVHVENALQDDETLSLHWHGLSMHDQNLMDGAAGITQSAIAAGASFTYDFVIAADQHGTFWYHAHHGVQRIDGLYGGLVVHKPAENDGALDNLDEHLLLISDHYHRPAIDALTAYMHPGAFGLETVPDSLLINGQGVFQCADAVPARPLDCLQRDREELSRLRLDLSKTNLLRIVNAGAYAGFNVSLVGADLTPVKVDGGHLIDGQPARSVGVLHPGERMDLLVQPNSHEASPKDSLTVTLDQTPFKYENSALTPVRHHPVSWVGVTEESIKATSPRVDSFDIQKANSLHPQNEILPHKADHTLLVYAITQKLAHLENEPHGFMNHSTWQEPTTEPLTSLSRTQWDEHQLVPHIDYNAEAPTWIDIIINNLDEEGHPFHLHGYDFWVLSTYSSRANWGSYNPYKGEAPGGAYDLTRALKKDTVYVPRRGYAVLRFRADNPGLWMFHCHNILHLASGMAMALDVS